MKNKMKKTQIQAGFAAIQTLLIAVILVMVGGVGWYVWRTSDQANKNMENAESTAQKTAAASAKNSYLVLKEWGVKFKIPSDQNGVTYFTTPDVRKGETPQAVYLTSKTLYDTTHHTLSCQTGGIENVILSRYKVGDNRPFGTPYSKEELDNLIKVFGAKVGDYYYLPSDPNYCQENAVALQTDKAARQGSEYETELTKSISTIEAIKQF
jgi:uncharacterized protein (UPF0333 family)